MNEALIALKLLDALLLTLSRLPVAATQIRTLRSELEQMRVEGRDPTDEEWAAVNRSIEDKLRLLG